MTLKLNTRLVDGITVVDCHGRIIFGDESSMLREAVKLQLKTSKDIVINLADVNYIDSGGLGTLQPRAFAVGGRAQRQSAGVCGVWRAIWREPRAVL